MPETHNSEAITLLFASTGLILLMLLTIVFIVLFQQKRKHLHGQQLKDVANQYEKALLQSELKIQEETFRAISQNLHDNIGSNISTAMLLLYKDEQTTAEEEEVNRKDALKQLGTVVDDLKNISRSLNPGYLHEIGLSEAVRHRIEQLERSKRYKVAFCINEAIKPLERQKQLILFYIFQEAISNIHKHAQAKNIRVCLRYETDYLEMQVMDDGTGFTIAAAKETGQRGSGFINMKNGAALINAELKIESGEGGTSIKVSVPQPYVQE